MDKLTKPLSSLEAACALGVSKRTMRRYISAGVVPTYRLPSGHVRIHPNVIEELTRPVGPQNKHLLIRRGWRERPALKAGGYSHDDCGPLRKRRPPLSAKESQATFFDTSPEALGAVRSESALSSTGDARGARGIGDRQ
jgi:excisionase family DNA binding protein